MASTQGDLITFPRLGARRQGLLEPHAVASLTRHLLRVVLLALAFLGHGGGREVIGARLRAKKRIAWLFSPLSPWERVGVRGFQGQHNALGTLTLALSRREREQN